MVRVIQDGENETRLIIQLTHCIQDPPLGGTDSPAENQIDGDKFNDSDTSEDEEMNDPSLREDAYTVSIQAN